MIENNENIETQKPKKKYAFGKAFVNIMLFPFRVAFFAIKWAIRIILLLFLVLFLYIGIHGAVPMKIPEAQGASFYQFMAERHQAMINAPKYDAKFERQMFGFVNLNYFTLFVFVIPFCDVFPENDKLEKVAHCSELAGSSYANMFRVPRENPKWTDLPSLQWETYERFMWEIYVKSMKLPEPDFSKNK